MVTKQLEFVLQGDVLPQLYSAAADGVRKIVEGLTAEIGEIDQAESASGERPEAKWRVGEVSKREATITIVGHSDSEAFLDRVCRTALEVPARVSRGDYVEYSSVVEGGVRQLLGVVNGHVGAVAVRYEGDVALFESKLPKITRRHDEALGAIEGLVLTLRGRQGLEFTLYDYIFKHGIRCVISKDLEEQARRSWRRRVLVHGTVIRHPQSGQPLQIRDVTEIEILEEIKSGAYSNARGAAHLAPGELLVATSDLE